MFGYGYSRSYTGDPLVDQFFSLIESESGESFSDIRSACIAANKCEGRYASSLRNKIAHVRWVIEGMDGYEQITHARPTAFGCEINTSRGLNIPWEAKAELKKLLWKYLEIDTEKDKDSIGKSIWKVFYEGAFWTNHRH